MSLPSGTRLGRYDRLCALLAILLFAKAHAERLPIRTYTVADGLARNRVASVMQDRHGFLWISTSAGLSRFDGYGFTSFGPEDGLPSDVVHQALEDREGSLWVATSKGLARFDPKAELRMKPFESVPLPPGEHFREVELLLEESTGSILAATGGGLLRVDPVRRPVRAEPVDLGPDVDLRKGLGALALDARTKPWFLAYGRIFHLDGSHIESRPLEETVFAHASVHCARALPDGRFLVGTSEGIFEADPGAQSRDAFRLRVPAYAGPPQGIGTAMDLSLGRDGLLLVVGPYGFFRVDPDDGSFRTVLTAPQFWSVLEDRDGNVWLGSSSQGLLRINRNGPTTYGVEDGLPNYSAKQIGQSANGEIFLIHYPLDVRAFGRSGLDPLATPIDLRGRFPGWGQQGVVLQDRFKEWWIASRGGLLRFRAHDSIKDLARDAPLRIYEERDGLPGNEVFQIVEDLTGDVWIGTITEKGGIARFRRESGTFQSIPLPEGLAKGQGVSALAVDASNAVWAGFFGGGLACVRKGRLEPRPLGEATPEEAVSMILNDSHARLWIATPPGVLRVDHPDSPAPEVKRYTTKDGLASNHVRSIIEDAFGRIYLGGSSGIDRLDPATGGIRHLTAQEGLLGEELEGVAFRDRSGDLWFGTTKSVCRLTPVVEPGAPPAPAFISGVRIAGASWPISVTGESRIETLRLGPEQRNIEFEFGALEYRTGNRLLYQTRLEGADRDWSAPLPRRTISYASLAPGSYRFLARAVDGDGLPGALATVDFMIEPPLWQRAWFRMLAAALLAALATAAYRYRIARVRELERVRTRIATDLHDDVGSGLTYIAMVSDRSRQRDEVSRGRLEESLGRIATVSSELVDSMSDIVWAINPAKDTLADLVQRMRWFANDLCEARGITLTFEAPTDAAPLPLPAEQRRQAYLLFKEAITNLARHSECREAHVRVDHVRNRLRILLQDDGKGIEPAPTAGGTGLPSMKRRAAAAGGTAEVGPREGAGTEVTIELPIRRGRRERATPP